MAKAELREQAAEIIQKAKDFADLLEEIAPNIEALGDAIFIDELPDAVHTFLRAAASASTLALGLDNYDPHHVTR